MFIDLESVDVSIFAEIPDQVPNYDIEIYTNMLPVY